VHDARLVATMLSHGVHYLLTFNGDDFRRYADLITIIDAGAP
jgi:predicted nucleic acid-binding protein